MKQTLSLVRKELNSYFGSPLALIFVGAFLVATLFIFFWAEAFFARGIADVRPMFAWMPILLIFLVAALTMRQWSEEEQSGTLEILLTMPARLIQLVWSKFLAAMILVCITLALTLFLPITVSLMGNLDWGPVAGGYLAAILLAAAYVAIGLFISSRTNNQIVALILTVLVGGVFYLVGSRGVTDFASDRVAEILRAIGSGSRFESIQRGVVDVRDLIYYVSIAALFLTLNVVSLDSKRWSSGEQTRPHRMRMLTTAWLVGLNVLALNIWLFPLTGIRLDLTAQREYSLSAVTRDLLRNLREPLLIRGYFSEKTHPLLAPLVPTVRDTLQEYQIASNGNVRVEIVDPVKDQEKMQEANQVYGIRPTPLQVGDRYGVSVVNAYFDILVRYGDQNVVLNFRDLIDIPQTRTGTPEVRLRNLEYDLTRAIKKVVYGFQSLDAVLAAMQDPVKLTLYYTPATLPEPLNTAPETIQKVAEKIQADSGGKFSFEMVDLDAKDSPVTRQTMMDKYRLNPIAVSLFSDQTYYLHMILQVGDQQPWLLNPAGDFSEASVRLRIESTLKRLSPGFLKVVGIWTPPALPTRDMFGQQQESIKQYRRVGEQLRQQYELRPLQLSEGQVPNDIDVLLVIAPQNLTDKERYAIDQYLMRGGTVVVAAGNYALTFDAFSGGLGLEQVKNGLQEMLASYGISVEKSLVMDTQGQYFLMPIGGSSFQPEYVLMRSPFAVDVRSDGMDRQHPILASLPAVTLSWTSPISVEVQSSADRQVTVLLQSSPGSWLTTNTNIQPDLKAYPERGFPIEGEQKAWPLAVAVQGIFQSYFKGKASPLESTPTPVPGVTPTPTPLGQAEPQKPAVVGTIESSLPTARLVVIGSAEFLNDLVFDVSRMLPDDPYQNNLTFIQNAVDWAVEDVDLLNIRARGSAARLLKPTVEEQQSFWEGLNYAAALVALVVIAGVWRIRQRNEQPMLLSEEL